MLGLLVLDFNGETKKEKKNDTRRNDTRGVTGGETCSKCERQGHNLFYLDNTAQVRGVLRGTLSKEDW